MSKVSLVVPSQPFARVRLRESTEAENRRNAFGFTRCIHLSKEAILRATRSSTDCRALLEHLAAIAKPRDGAPLMLLLFARLATVACDWLDGDLFISMEALQCSSTRVTVATELGSGMREKVFPSFDMNVPLDELTGAVERIPQMVHPLVAEIAQGQLLLSASAHLRASTLPPEVTIDRAALLEDSRASQPRRAQ